MKHLKITSHSGNGLVLRYSKLFLNRERCKEHNFLKFAKKRRQMQNISSQLNNVQVFVCFFNSKLSKQNKFCNGFTKNFSISSDTFSFYFILNLMLQSQLKEVAFFLPTSVNKSTRTLKNGVEFPMITCK